MQIRLKPSQKIHIKTSTNIFQILQPTFLRQSKLDRDREHLWLLCLDPSQTVRTLELLGLGTRQTVLIDAMEVFHRALLRRAASIVVAHNHPSGNLKPSRSDIIATEKLAEASRFLNIKLHDHLIISETAFYSFRDGGELEKLAPGTCPGRRSGAEPGMEAKKFIMSHNTVLAME